MKWQLIILVVVLIKTTIAMDEELFIPNMGDEEIYVFTAGDIELGEYFTSIVTIPPPEEEPRAGGGQGSAHQVKIRRGAKLTTPYYDILIEGIKSVYNVEDIVYFNITLINKGDVPDRDAVLTYYLLGPDYIRYNENRELFEEIPPTCLNATLNRYEQICEYENGSTFEPSLFILERELALPLDTPKGYWKVYAEYETEIQPLVEVYKSFRVGYTYVIPIIIGLILLFQNKRERRWQTENY